MNKEKLEEFKKLLVSGEIYDCTDEEFLSYQFQLLDRIKEYNDTLSNADGLKQREKMLKELLAECGSNLIILPPMHANCGLMNVHIGNDVFINYNASFVDDGPIYIGDETMFGPNVTVITASHPISPKLRKYKLQYNQEVRIGKNVWVGANAIILPGVHIGDNSIVGAGAVVTKDVPNNVIVVGNPAKILRKITSNDDEFYEGKRIPEELLKRYK